MDLSTVTGAQGLARNFGEGEEGLDILVNNAGAAWGAPFDEFPEIGWDKAMDLNLKSPFFLTQALLPALEARASQDAPSKVITSRQWTDCVTTVGKPTPTTRRKPVSSC
jgi:NAD(P)-dependent dehydrogenase (short-subunit alcohol dehydrogenase family)